MGHREFPQVYGYRPDYPEMPGSLSRSLWKAFFTLDWIFSLSDVEDEHGIVPPKTRQRGAAGRIYRRLYQRIFDDLAKQTAGQCYSRPFRVPEVSPEAFPPSEFKRWRLEVNHPIVIRGLVADSVACREWGVEWLVSHFGDRSVRCVRFQDGVVALGQNIELRESTLKDFLVDDASDGYYVNNFTGIFAHDDIVRYCNGDEIDRLRGKERHYTQWFISRARGTGSGFHCANGQNIFLNLCGNKEWTFVHPSYNPVMLPALSRFAVYALAEFDDKVLADLDQMYAKHPIFQCVPKYRVVLEPGDVLYNPPWWWHRVLNHSQLTIGCATRYDPDLSRYPGSFTPLQLIDLLKHPTRSFYANIVLERLFHAKPRMMDSIFSKRSKQPPRT